MFEFVFTSLNFLDNNTLSQPVVFLFFCCTQSCYFIADEVRAIRTENSINLKLVCSDFLYNYLFENRIRQSRDEKMR